jgi:hypothetical protein
MRATPLPTGCSNEGRLSGTRNAMMRPPQRSRHRGGAVVPGMPDVRYRVGSDNEAMQREAIAALEREKAYLAASGHKGPCRRRCSWRSPAAGSRAAARSLSAAPSPSERETVVCRWLAAVGLRLGFRSPVLFPRIWTLPRQRSETTVSVE